MPKVIHVFTVSMSITFLEGLYSKLSENGYELIVISAKGNEVDQLERKGYFKHYPVSMSRSINPFKDLVSLVKIIRIFIKEKPDIIHGHTPKAGLLAMIGAKFSGIKNRPYHLHGLKYPGEKGLKKLLIKFMEKKTVSLSTRVYAVSKSLAEYSITSGFIKSDKITVLHHGSVKGINIKESIEIRLNSNSLKSRLGIKPFKVIICFVGRITEEKGVFELIEAFKNLIKDYSDIGLVLCGPIEIKSKENKDIFGKFIKITSVQYFGMVNNPLEYIACSDIFVLPSWREGFGLVNIEANSVGVPVITTNIIGCKDSIEHEKTGLFIDTKDAMNLERTLKRLIDDPETRKKMGLNGIKRVTDLYDRDKIWNFLIDEYNTMIKVKG